MSSRGLFSAPGLLLAALNALAQAPPAQPQPTPHAPAAAQGFWAAVDQLGLIFRAIGNLGGAADRGQIWRKDLVSGKQQPMAAGAGLAWPVLSPDGTTVFALRDGQLVRLESDGRAIVVGRGTQWRKLVGVDRQNNVLGFIAGSPRVHPAVMSPTGELQLLPQPETDTEREHVSLLMQENRAYADGRELLVKRSTRGGRGFDVIVKTGDMVKAITDCGDDSCGQPSLSPDGHTLLYIRAPTE